MDDLVRLQTFITVADNHSFSAAARQLDTSVTSIARKINSLESELKIRLINRSSRGLALTEAGKLFYERACTISAQLKEAMHETSAFNNTVQGTLRISVRPTIGNGVIVPALPGFLEQYPDLNVHVSLSEERQDLIANDIDVALWMGDIPDSTLIARRLTTAQRILCAAPGYLEKHGVPEYPIDLLTHKCVVLDRPGFSKRWNFSKAGKTEEVVVQGSIIAQNGLTLYAAALAGGGIVIAHEAAVQTLVAQGKLVPLLSEYLVSNSAVVGDLYAVYPSSRGLSKKVRVFVDFLVQLFTKSQVNLDRSA